MTDDELKQIEERLKLVPGPLEIDDLSTDILGPEDEWEPEDSGGAVMIHGIPYTQVEEGWYFTRDSAKFFANTLIDTAALIAGYKERNAEVERLKKEVKKLRHEIKEITPWPGSHRMSYD